MKKNTGFTLIELLVVVLIIGILSAVALPQYTKAVEKSRMTEAVMAVEEIARANQLYYLANASYTRDINDLDIGYSLPDTVYANGTPGKLGKDFVYAASNDVGSQTYIAVAARRNNSSDNAGGKVYTLLIGMSGNKNCYFYSGATEYQKKLCSEWSSGNSSNFTQQ